MYNRNSRYLQKTNIEWANHQSNTQIIIYVMIKFYNKKPLGSFISRQNLCQNHKTTSLVVNIMQQWYVLCFRAILLQFLYESNINIQISNRINMIVKCRQNININNKRQAKTRGHKMWHQLGTNPNCNNLSINKNKLY